MNLVILALGIIAVMISLPIANLGSVNSQNSSSVLEQAQKSLQDKTNTQNFQANDLSLISQKVGNKTDLVFNAQELKTSIITKEFKLDGEVWNEICPSGQCHIEEDRYSLYVVTPNSDDSSPRVYAMMWFDVHDNITNKNLTPLQKTFAERYQLSFSCSVNSVNDIIEQGNNVAYKCSGGSTFLQKQNKEDSDSTYFFKVEGTYDNQSDTLNSTGQLDYKM